MNLKLKGRKALVCASSKGLGYACAMELAKNGAITFVNGRSEKSLCQAAEEIAKESSGKVIPITADINTPEGRENLLAACPDPDILVNNNAGPPFSDFRNLDEKKIHEGLAANMVTPILLVKGVIDGMVERRFGRIVNITSASVKMPIYGLDLSSGARAGLTAFLAGIAREVAKHNVTINALLPGMFETGRLKEIHIETAKMKKVSVEDLVTARLAQIPVGRFGDPKEFGKMCAFLCSFDSGYITGQSILMDGGQFNATF